MTQIRIDLTDNQLAILQDITPDPRDWLINALSARIATAVSDRKGQPGWASAVVQYAATGGDPEDDQAVHAHGVKIGIFKDAAARNAEAEAALAAEIDQLAEP